MVEDFCIYHVHGQVWLIPKLSSCFLSAFLMFVYSILDQFHSLYLTPILTLKEAFLYGLVSVFCLDGNLMFVIIHKWNAFYPYLEWRVVFLISLLLTYQYLN